jgi:hypothetical protein
MKCELKYHVILIIKIRCENVDVRRWRGTLARLVLEQRRFLEDDQMLSNYLYQQLCGWM